MIGAHCLLNFCDGWKDADGKEIRWGALWSIRIDGSSLGIELEDSEDGMGGDACDMLLEFKAKLREGGDVLNGGDLFESHDGGSGLELGDGPFDEGGIEF
jgi:hypothetical protein